MSTPTAEQPLSILTSRVSYRWNSDTINLQVSKRMVCRLSYRPAAVPVLDWYDEDLSRPCSTMSGDNSTLTKTLFHWWYCLTVVKKRWWRDFVDAIRAKLSWRNRTYQYYVELEMNWGLMIKYLGGIWCLHTNKMWTLTVQIMIGKVSEDI